MASDVSTLREPNGATPSIDPGRERRAEDCGFTPDVSSQTLMAHSYRVIRRMRYGQISTRERHNDQRRSVTRVHLNGVKALAEAMPVQTPGSGSDGVTVLPSSTNR